MNYYIITFGFNSDDGYKVVNSRPIYAKDEDEATEKLIEQFENYEGIPCEVYGIKKVT